MSKFDAPDPARRRTVGVGFQERSKMAVLADRFVGRVEELDLLDSMLAELARGCPAMVELRGEPGIGKTRLLEELATRADARSWLVLTGSASELERDLPFSVLVDAMDEYLRGLAPGDLDSLDDDVRAELAHVLPSLSAFAGSGAVAVQHERYRAHWAVRALVEHLARDRPLVLELDDLQWADSATIELLGALLRRPPAASVLMAVAVRPRRVPERLSVALDRALRSGALIRIELGALTLAETREFLGEAVDASDAAVIHEESGGNPFYVEQLARSSQIDRASASQSWLTGIGVPSAVAASLSEELAPLPEGSRRLLEGAAVAGDPFELELAGAAAAVPETTAMDAIDELLLLGLIRTTDVPRRFRFRHPLVRRAVYEATAGGWRIGAHERCAQVLAARGASPLALAHHVSCSARDGDLGAVSVLGEAGRTALRLAPASAARWFDEALRLLPQTAPAEGRIELLQGRAAALTAVGRLDDSRRALLDAIAIVPSDSPPLQAKLARACAGVESVLGLHEQANQRLTTTLEGLADPDSQEGVALMIELAMNGFWRARYPVMQQAAERAVSAARTLGDTPLTAASLAVLALADSIMGAADRAESGRAEAAALVASLSDDELADRLDAAAWLAGAELYLDRYADADGHAVRALALGRATGQGELFLVLVQILGRVWYVRGKLAEAADLLDGGIEASRLSGNTLALVWNLFNRSVVALATGDLELAISTSEESVELCRGLGEGFHSAWAAVRLAGVSLEAGNPTRAVELLLGCAGGEDQTLIPGSWRAYCLELLTRCWLALDRPAEAARSAASAREWAAAVHLPLADAWAARAAAAIELHRGDPAGAAELALTSASAAELAGAPIEAALGRLLAGRALALAEERDRAAAELEHAAATLDAFGANRYRDSAERELRKLGRRIHRRTRPGTGGVIGIDALTGRELQVARLVVERKTNAEIADELFLSLKTVESHLRNIFHKVDVSSRAELARAVERADHASHTVAG